MEVGENEQQIGEKANAEQQRTGKYNLITIYTVFYSGIWLNQTPKNWISALTKLYMKSKPDY